RRMSLARHSFILLVIAPLALGCSKKQDAGGEGAPPAGSAGSAAAKAVAQPEAPKPPEKPPAPPETLEGDSRVVNLLLDEAGKPMTIDVWGKRSFEYGPMQFAKEVAYGTVTPHFGIP